MFVVGKKEAENKTVTIRKLGSDKQDTMKLDSAIQEIVKKSKLPSSMKKK